MVVIELQEVDIFLWSDDFGLIGDDLWRVNMPDIVHIDLVPLATNSGAVPVMYRIARNFHQERISTNFSTCFDDYTNDIMTTFTALKKVEYFFNARAAGLGESFCPAKMCG